MPKQKGATNAVIWSIASIEHLDPNSEEHEKGQKFSVERRVYLSRLQQLSKTFTKEEKFPSMGKGFMMDKTGKEITSEAHRNLLETVKRQRRQYVRQVKNRNGTLRDRYEDTNAVRQIAVTFRPQDALAIMTLEKEKKVESRDLLMHWAPIIGKAFESATRYDVLALQVHAQEGCLHFHVTYSTVSRTLELLHAEYRRGRHGKPFLQAALMGALRLGEEGLIPPEQMALAQFYLKSRRRTTTDDPADWRMAKMLDGLVGIFAERDIETRKAFDAAAADYRATFASGESLNRSALLEHCRAVETRIKEGENEIADLKEMFDVMVAEKDKKFASQAEDAADAMATTVKRLNLQIETLGRSIASGKDDLKKSLQQVGAVTADRDKYSRALNDQNVEHQDSLKDLQARASRELAEKQRQLDAEREKHLDAAARAREENAGLRRTIGGLKFARQRAEEKSAELGPKVSGLSATDVQLQKENEKLKKVIPAVVPAKDQPGPISTHGPESLDRAIYHVVLDGRGVCPFTLEDIKELIAQKTIRQDTPVWRTGLENWSTAVSLPELKGHFPDTYTKTFRPVGWSHAKQPELYFVIDAQQGTASPAMTLEAVEAAIASKKIQPSTYVWREGMVCYDRAENVPELRSALVEQMGTPSVGGFEH